MDITKEHFVKKITELKIGNKSFEEVIPLFSKYLSYYNPDYKYNATYLNEYIGDFILFKDMLIKKMQVYNKILKFLRMTNINMEYSLFLDESFRIINKKVKGLFDFKAEFVNIDVTKIQKELIYVNLQITHNNSLLLFYKEYKYKGYSLITEDIESFIDEVKGKINGVI